MYDPDVSVRGGNRFIQKGHDLAHAAGSLATKSAARASRRASNAMGHHKLGLLHMASAHLRSKDIIHVNTGKHLLEIVHRVVYGPPLMVLFFFFITFITSTVLFASILYIFGEECFNLESSFGFAPMLWISVHVFSTIGFGNIGPKQSCGGAQIVVLIEAFFSILLLAAIGGYVVKSFLRPLSAVRFSTKVLVNSGRRRVDNKDKEEEEARAIQSIKEEAVGNMEAGNLEGPSGTSIEARLSLRRYSNTEYSSFNSKKYRFLTFRMVRQGRVQLRDIRIALQAQYWISGTTSFGDRDSHKGRVVSLQLEQDYFTSLEQLQVWHRIDEQSPLWRMRDLLHVHLDGLEVSVSAFDMASLQQVMFYKRYEKTDLLQGSVFENTLNMSSKREGGLEADHSKLDLTTEEERPIGCPSRTLPQPMDNKQSSVRNMTGYVNRRRGIGQRTRSSESGPDGDSSSVADMNNTYMAGGSKTWTMKNFSSGGCWRGSRKSEAEDDDSSTGHDEVSNRRRGKPQTDPDGVVARKGSHVFMNSISALFSVRNAQDESDRVRANPRAGMPQNGRRSVTHFADQDRTLGRLPISV